MLLKCTFFTVIYLLQNAAAESPQSSSRKNPHIFSKQLEGWEDAPAGSNTPLGCTGTCCSHPKHRHHTRAVQNPGKAFLASEQEGVCNRHQCPRKTAREDRQRGLDPNLNKESKPDVGVSSSRAQVADGRDGCRSLDEDSSHFQLNLPSS